MVDFVAQTVPELGENFRSGFALNYNKTFRISSGWCLVQRTTGQERNISVTIAGSATGNVGTVHTQLNHLYLETDSVSEF